MAEVKKGKGGRNPERASSGDESPQRKGGFLSAFLNPPERARDQGEEDEDSPPRRPPIKWRAVLLGAGAMLIGAIAVQLAVTPFSTRSRLEVTAPGGESLATSVKGGRGPSALAYSWPTTTLIAVNQAGNDIWAFDGDGNRRGDALAVGKGPNAVAADPDRPLAYVTGGESNDLTFVDVGQMTVSGTVGVGTNPIAVAISPARRRIFVANYTSGDLSVVDMDSRVSLPKIPVGNRIQAVTVAGSRDFVFVASAADNKIFVVDPAQNSVTSTIEAGGRPVALATTTGGRVVSADFESKSLTFFDPESGAKVGSISLPARPNSIAQDPTTGRLVVGSNEASSLYVVEPSTGDILSKVKVEIGPLSVAAGAQSNFYAYGIVPLPKFLIILIIAVFLLVVACGGFVAAFVSKAEPIRHASWALGGFFLVLWLLVGGGQIAALLPLAFAAVFALPIAALGGFVAGRKTGAIEKTLPVAIKDFVVGKRGSEPAEELEEANSTPDGDDGKAPRRKPRKKKSGEESDSEPID